MDYSGLFGSGLRFSKPGNCSQCPYGPCLTELDVILDGVALRGVQRAGSLRKRGGGDP